jgi:hypothetical protein
MNSATLITLLYRRAHGKIDPVKNFKIERRYPTMSRGPTEGEGEIKLQFNPENST